MVPRIMTRLAASSPVQILARWPLPGLLVALLFAGCASVAQDRQPEGQVVFHAGTQRADAGASPVTPGPPFRRLAILIPAYEPARTADWARLDRKKPEGGGAVVGLGVGMMILQSTPLFLLTWPVAVGVVAGTSILGAVGEFAGDTPFAAIDAADQASLSEVANRLRPEPWLRQDVGEALARRTGDPPVSLQWYPTLGPDTPGTDPLADAREQGIDGLLNLVVESFGLAVGEDEGSFGTYVRIRSQWIETSTGRVRYERVLECGPGRAMPGLPRPADHALGLLALDKGLVFRQEVREAIAGLARILVEDPALPVAHPQ
jgi:hypothetical protein